MKVTSYDDFGNPVRSDSSGNALVSGTTVVRQYQTDQSIWQLGLVVSSVEYADPQTTVVLRNERHTYDAVTRQVITRGHFDNATGQWLDTIYGYDVFGNPISKTDATGAIKLTTYDTNFNSFIASETVTPNATTSLTQCFTYEPNFGYSISHTDPAGGKSSRELDGLGRVVSKWRTAPDETLVQVSLTTWSMATGMLCRSDIQRLDWSSDTWSKHCAFFDGLGRTIRTERDAVENNTAIAIVTTYNGVGAKMSQTLPYFDGGAVPFTSSWEYDEFGRVISGLTPAADGTAKLTTTTYPRVDTVTTTIAAGTSVAQTTTVKYAIAKNQHVPIARIDNEGLVTRYTYDGLGQMLELTDPSNIVTSATFDTLGRQLLTSISEGGTILTSRSNAYQDLARSVTETNAYGTITLVRDAVQRVIEKQSATGEKTTLLYDETDVPFGTGRLTTVQLPSGTTLRYGYDAQGRLTMRRIVIDGIDSSIMETFLPNGQRESITFPDGSQQTNIYGSSGALISVEFAAAAAQAQSLIQYSRFDARDNPQQIQFANGVNSSIEYDIYGRMALKTVTGAESTVLFAYSLKRDLADAVVQAGMPSSLEQFEYDPVGRLQSAQGGMNGSQTFTYDQSGNCTNANGTAITYRGYSAVAGTGIDAFEATYDGDGALLQLTRDTATTNYLYDELRLTSVIGPDGETEATNSYDHTGRRLVKTELGISTYYIGPEYEIVRYSDGSTQHSCIVGERGVRDYIVTTVDSGTAQPCNGVPSPGEAYFIYDHLRSVRAVLDSIGTLTAELSYCPFGVIVKATGSASFRYRFSGREYDTSAGAYYFLARYYHPNLRRFLTPDDRLGGRLLDRDTFNSYAYVLNNPVALIDSTGHNWGDFIGQTIVDVAMVTAGVVVTGITGGAASAVSSSLLGAGIGGLVYDVVSASEGKGADASWKDWGVQFGIGAATGLLLGGLSPGMQGLVRGMSIGARVAITGATMGTAGAGIGMAGVVASNAASGNKLTNGLGMAAIVGGATGAIGYGWSEALTPDAALAGEQGVEMVPQAQNEIQNVHVAADPTIGDYPNIEQMNEIHRGWSEISSNVTRSQFKIGAPSNLIGSLVTFALGAGRQTDKF